MITLAFAEDDELTRYTKWTIRGFIRDVTSEALGKAYEVAPRLFAGVLSRVADERERTRRLQQVTREKFYAEAEHISAEEAERRRVN